ncbi:2-amino-5-chloromuconate deaminase [Nitrospirillum viridazoti Y2]|uniref:Aspartyl-tRNA(Asn)/glutamyl-tRNA(Gln) amidotransferase subunit A n=1 Tax=Nitrospirillum amazonense TaxID=28077 RepID=A0A560HLF6_9PROT|nr:amidase [Nitrospirillum amazonense]EGY01252.1 2-amino-5-chloromuconate deaminase [Nitrospirillum amazonense Y2]TWB47335.1 aspartyl-tRNA(Asn)/glutamyl-tRNA(Gln) amidotransferase subunit A [Nitrospirillum amazonense]
MDLTTALAALKDGTLTARDLAEACIAARAERPDARDNPYVAFSARLLRAQADAADVRRSAGQPLSDFDGIPLSLKDNYGTGTVCGGTWPVFAGSPRRLPPMWNQPGGVVSRLLAQGAVVTGKTRMVEFAFGGLGANGHWGTPRNPWDRDHHRVPGGSSTGAPLSLHEGSALLALGTDTAGSVRIPAAWNGLYGYKSARGHLATDGIVPLSPRLDTVGILALTADDLAHGYRLVTGTAIDPLMDPDVIRIGRAPAALWQDCSPGVVAAVDTALDRLTEVFRPVGSVTIPELDEALALFRRGGLAGAEIYGFLGQELPAWLPSLDAYVGPRIRASADVLDYDARVAFLDRFANGVQALFHDADVVALPTVAITPPLLADLAEPSAYGRANLMALRNCCVANLGDMAAVTLPVGTDDAGCPVGLQLLAPRGADARLLAIAQAAAGCLVGED